jgi:hypothetical protein
MSSPESSVPSMGLKSAERLSIPACASPNVVLVPLSVTVSYASSSTRKRPAWSTAAAAGKAP